jgi:hypothetical protein
LPIGLPMKGLRKQLRPAEHRSEGDDAQR